MGLFSKRSAMTPGQRGLSIGKDELEESYYWVYATWKEPHPGASRRIWDFRFELGRDIPVWELLPQNQRFWFDAYAALAARMLKEHRERFDVDFARELDRRASECVDTENESQVQALRTLSDQPL